MAAGLGFKDFTTGEVLTANDVDGYLMQGVWVFADAAARTAAVTSPQEGNISFLKDTNSTEYYSGSAWVAVGGSSGLNRIYTTTFSGVNSISLPNDTFTSTYDNYRIIINVDSISSGSTTSNFRLRAAGVDNSSANYDLTSQEAYSTAATYSAVNAVSQTSGRLMFIDTGNVSVGTFDLFNPKKSAKTIAHKDFSRIIASGDIGREIGTVTFGLTTSFDSLTYFCNNMTGSISVYGYGKA